MKETRLVVPDMSCGHCVATVQRALESLEGVEAVDISLDTKLVVALVHGSGL
jgi:copper chaperone CopZ